MEDDDLAPEARAARERRMRRHVYETPIGPVCMSEEEHDAYLGAREEQELDADEQDS